MLVIDDRGRRVCRHPPRETGEGAPGASLEAPERCSGRADQDGARVSEYLPREAFFAGREPGLLRSASPASGRRCSTSWDRRGLAGISTGRRKEASTAPCCPGPTGRFLRLEALHDGEARSRPRPRASRPMQRLPVIQRFRARRLPRSSQCQCPMVPHRGAEDRSALPRARRRKCRATRARSRPSGMKAGLERRERLARDEDAAAGHAGSRAGISIS
jgi:hypothetical protein